MAELLRTSFLNIEIPSFVSVCDGTSIDMTLNVPKQASVNGDIDELVVDNSVLTGTAAVSEIVKGTYRLDGTGAMNRAAGAAYFFGYDGSVWSQVIKVVDENRVSGDEFGYSVAISGVYAVVGVPGKGNATGEINIFQYASGAWSLVRIQHFISLSDLNVAFRFKLSLVHRSNHLKVIGLDTLLQYLAQTL